MLHAAPTGTTAPAVLGAESDSAKNTDSSRPRALVVEDDPDAAEVALGMLSVLGYRTEIAVDGHQALYSLSRDPPELVLLDICLPEMDGLTMLRVARRVVEARGVPVVAASAVYPPDSAVAALLAEMGVTSYLSKPFNLAGLRMAVSLAHPDGPAGRRGPPSAAPNAAGRASHSPRRDVPLGASRIGPATGAEPALRAAPAAPSAPSASAASATSVTTQPREAAPGPPAPPSTPSLPRVSGPSAEAPPPSPIFRMDEVVARVDCDGQPTLAAVIDCGSRTVTLRSPSVALPAGSQVRLDVPFREVIHDATVTTDLRATATVFRCDRGNDGWRCQLEARVLHPRDGWDRLARALRRG
jgi:CheY-like chemotaxis protein